MEERTRDSDPETGYKVATGGGGGGMNLYIVTWLVVVGMFQSFQ